MKIVKILGTAAMCAAPLSVAAAQSATTPDSGNGNHRGKWIAATGTVAGTALFLAFTKSGGSNTNTVQASDPGASAPTAPLPTVPPVSFTTTQPPAATPPAATPPAARPPAAANAPANTGSVTPPPDDGPPPPDPFVLTTENSTVTPPANNPPHEDAPPYFEHSSTVPEPGSLLLTATGIIGLLPLIRRRHR